MLSLDPPGHLCRESASPLQHGWAITSKGFSTEKVGTPSSMDGASQRGHLYSMGEAVIAHEATGMGGDLQEMYLSSPRTQLLRVQVMLLSPQSYWNLD